MGKPELESFDQDSGETSKKKKKTHIRGPLKTWHSDKMVSQVASINNRNPLLKLTK